MKRFLRSSDFVADSSELDYKICENTTKALLVVKSRALEQLWKFGLEFNINLNRANFYKTINNFEFHLTYFSVKLYLSADLSCLIGGNGETISVHSMLICEFIFAL